MLVGREYCRNCLSVVDGDTRPCGRCQQISLEACIESAIPNGGRPVRGVAPEDGERVCPRLQSLPEATFSVGISTPNTME